jgi:chromosome segregation ATPase
MRPFLRSNTTLREVDRLLNKPSVRFAANQVPLAQRNLLDDPVAQSHLSLQQLVDVMTQAFDSARDAVTKYDQVMARLTPELAATDRQLAALDDRAGKLGSQATAAVQSLRTSLQETRRQALDDPLAAQVGFDQTLQQRLRQLSDQLGAIEQERDGVRDELARAQARQARAERVRGLDPAQVAGLRAWLADIASTVEAGQYTAARIGLQRWNAEADGPYTAEEQRQEQLGLLKALRSMAQRRRERGAQIDPDLDAVALEAEAALRHDPPDLLRAAQLVERYQRGVTAS